MAAFSGAKVQMGRVAQNKRAATQCRAAADKEVPGTEAKGLGKALPMEMDIDQIMAGSGRVLSTFGEYTAFGRTRRRFNKPCTTNAWQPV